MLISSFVKLIVHSSLVKHYLNYPQCKRYGVELTQRCTGATLPWTMVIVRESDCSSATGAQERGKALLDVRFCLPYQPSLPLVLVKNTCPIKSKLILKG